MTSTFNHTIMESAPSTFHYSNQYKRHYLIARIDTVLMFLQHGHSQCSMVALTYVGTHPVRLVVERGRPARLIKDAVQFRYLL